MEESTNKLLHSQELLPRSHKCLFHSDIMIPIHRIYMVLIIKLQQ